ncbi:MAG: 3-hydroxyacyl-CoA dehydrogenase NAD-binding domain-containing protein [Pseudomonadota bacterium]|nr:enoyl-CoA hydratase/isomerase family protein [Rubrivivax sp.]MCA3257534.1 enoyl-CoA hydratase/isomerase family protein [Rubrivivax sp.]MCZ8029910.1 3-hydroxyacyl-CoA dehydrogenase NAD-binding domain-containing protein [Rubrivivax sp.]
MSDAVSLEVGSDGILVATMNLPGRPMNVVGDELMAGIAAAVDRLSDPAVKGMILASGKADFCAGGDIDRMAKWTQPEEPFEASMAMKKVLRRLELQGKPVVAAIGGHALGGGLEIALACHARIALADPRLKLGQPEVKIGLLPGGGGTVRLPRLVGIQAALQICGEGNDIAVTKAREMGLLADTAADRDELMAKARAWIAANPKARQPWDQPKFKFPGGDSRSPALVPMWAIAPSIASARSQGNYPALQHIMSSIFEGGLVDFETAQVVESRYFAACVTSQVSKNMIGTLWFQLNAIKKGASRPQGVPASKVRRLGILGAGMMGGGIAYVSAKAGIEVVLLDTTQEAADKGKAYSQGLLDKAVKKGRSTPDKRDALLARIRPTTQYEDLAACDLVIEAVFEDRAVKADVTRKAEAVLGAGAVFASNTSTLPITGLARASARPGSFIGLHFFSPVDKMPLVEIIVGQATSDETLARGFDYVLQIGKTPIVVNDSRGFYTSRVFSTYVMEGIAMLKEGVHPRSIEAAGLQAGMPMPPLALQDEVSLSLALHVAEQTRKDLAAEGRPYTEHPGMSVIRQLCEIGRVGKKAGRGFYDHGDEGRQLWPGLTTLYPVDAQQPAQRELIDRMMFAQANEAARCHEEGVLRSAADANVGSIFGWGFAPFHGGALQFIDAMGAAAFVARARELAAAYGPRFEPAAVVVQMAAQGGRFAA